MDPAGRAALPLASLVLTLFQTLVKINMLELCSRGWTAARHPPSPVFNLKRARTSPFNSSGLNEQ